MSVSDSFDVVRADEFIGGTGSFDVLEVGGQPVGATTLASAGAAVSLVEDGASPTLEVRSLVAGANVVLDDLGDGGVRVSASTGAGATLGDAGAPPPGGVSLVPGAPQAGPGLTVRTVSGGANVAVTEGATDVQLAASVPLARDPTATGASLVSGASTGASHVLRGLVSGDGSVSFAVAGEDVDVRTVAGVNDSIPLAPTATVTPASAVSLVASDSGPTDHRLRELYGGPGLEVVALGDYIRISEVGDGGGGGATLADEVASPPGGGATFASQVGPDSTASDHRVKAFRRATDDLVWVQDVPGSDGTLLELAFDATGLARQLEPTTPAYYVERPLDAAARVHDFNVDGDVKGLVVGWTTEFVRGFVVFADGAFALPATAEPGRVYHLDFRLARQHDSGNREGVGLRVEVERLTPSPTVLGTFEWRARTEMEAGVGRPVVDGGFAHNPAPGDQYAIKVYSLNAGSSDPLDPQATAFRLAGWFTVREV